MEYAHDPLWETEGGFSTPLPRMYRKRRERLKEILFLALDNMTIHDVADALDVSYSVASADLKTLGIQLKRKKKKTARDEWVLPAEEWRDVVGFEGLYEVSNYGSMRNPRTGRVLKTCPNTRGYPRVGLSVDGEQFPFCVHVLVLEAFVCPRPEGLVGNHRNGHPTDNYVGNLEWVTHNENIMHGVMGWRLTDPSPSAKDIHKRLEELAA